MSNKVWQFVAFCFGLASLASAQGLEHYLPVGFHNPLLKSGQYIFSVAYNNSNQENDQAGSTFEYGQRYLNAFGYLGMTDRITLSTNLNLFPRQTIWQSRGDNEGCDREDLNLSASVALSYRLHHGFELFSKFFYNRYKIDYGDRTYLTTVPVGIDPNTGAVIYEQRRILQPGPPDLRLTSTAFRIGLTFVGSLW